MLKIAIGTKNAPGSFREDERCMALGTPMEVTADLMLAIGTLYGTLKQRDAVAAEIFRTMLTDGLAQKNNPVWSLPLDKLGTSVSAVIPCREGKGGRSDG